MKLGDVFVTEIVGMQYQFRIQREFEIYQWKLVPGTEVKIKREPSNPRDRYACAMYLKRKRIGYLPARVAKRLAPKIDRGQRFRFFIFDLVDAYWERKVPTTTLLVLRDLK